MSENPCVAIRQLRRAAGMRALYPPEHLSHAEAVEAAETALRELLGERAEADIICARDVLRVDGEDLPDEDGALRILAELWWNQGIAGVTVRPGMTPREISLLLEMMTPSEDDDEPPLKERLKAAKARALQVKQIDYAGFVAKTDPGTTEDDDLPDDGAFIMKLVGESTKAPGELSDEQCAQALAMLDSPSDLAAALQAAVLAAFGMDPDDASEGAQHVMVGDVRIEKLEEAGDALARSLQRLSDVGAETSGVGPERVAAGLASAVREMEPELVALAFRAVGDTASESYQALRDIAKHLSTEEIIEIVRRAPHDVSNEASVVQRRLLERITGDPERLKEIEPALRESLVDDGMAEDVFENTMGLVMRSLREDATEGGAGFKQMALTESQQRRASMASALADAVGPDQWAPRALLCIDLLALPHPRGRHAAILTSLRDALAKISEDERPAAVVSVAVGLVGLIGPESPLPEVAEADAAAALNELGAWEQSSALAGALAGADADDRAALVTALAYTDDEGRGALLRLLGGDEEWVTPETNMLIATVLTEASNRGYARQDGVGLTRRVTDIDTDVARDVIGVLVARGGDAERVELSQILNEGFYPLRWEIIEGIGKSPEEFIDLLSQALRDSEMGIACAAAAYLALADDSGAGDQLFQQLRPFSPLDRTQALNVAVARGLGRLRYRGATPTLAEIVRKPSWMGQKRNDQLRVAAARALAQIATPASLRALAERVSDERSPRIRKLAGLAQRYLDTSAGDDDAQGDSHAA